MTAAKEEERHLREKQLEQAEVEMASSDMRTIARSLEERKRLQRRINDARARGEEVVDIVRVCLAHHFVSTMQERASAVDCYMPTRAVTCRPPRRRRRVTLSVVPNM